MKLFRSSILVVVLGCAAAPALAKDSLAVWNLPPEARAKERALWLEEAAGFEQSSQEKLGRPVGVRGISRDYIQQQFVTVMASGKGPDVVHLWVGALPTLARQGFLAPLDAEVAAWDQKDNVPEVFWQPARVDGKVYGVPYDSYFYVLLIRKDRWVQAGLDPALPPTNWEQLAEAAVKLTHRSQERYGFGYTANAETFMDFLWQAGGEVMRQDAAGAWHPAFQENPGQAAISFLRRLRYQDKVCQPNPLASKEELAQLFALGQLGMMIGVANQLPDLVQRYGLRMEDLLIAPLPAGPSGLQATHTGGDYFIINAQATPERKAQAWAYIRHILSPLNQLARWNGIKRLGIPVFPGAFSVTTDLLNLPEFKLVKDSLAVAKVEPHFERWPQVKDMLETRVLQRLFIDPKADPAEILQAGAAEVEKGK